MELHSLLGHQPNSPIIELALLDIAGKCKKDPTIVSTPTVKVYRDAVYHSYFALGISFNYEPSTPLVPSAYSIKDRNNISPEPDSSLLKLVAIHLYRAPVDKFETFPTSFLIPGGAVSIAGAGTTDIRIAEMDLNKKAFEVVQLLGEPEERSGGGRQGNCWIGYQKSRGLAVDFVGSNWDDRNMTIGSITITVPVDQ
ncbi:hypothetical protein BGZ46_009689 [Entomortierella lignicola]|nr:hypothetical protein BGZ46_009689 [Entomortierella lignicola]